MTSVTWERYFPQLESLIDFACYNPFLLERAEIERSVLAGFKSDSEKERSAHIYLLAQRLLGELRDSSAGTATLSSRAIELYETLVLFFLIRRYLNEFDLLAKSLSPKKQIFKALFYENFLQDAEHYLGAFSQRFFRPFNPAHWFAFSFQVSRAFFSIAENVIGTSTPVAGLRAAMWQSIFTHDLRRHLSSSNVLLRNIPTLILGPVGSTMDAVAEIIGRSRYIPFDTETKSFVDNFDSTYATVNLHASLSPAADSELFGHCSGFFAGDMQERQGILEKRKPYSTLYLNEIGEASDTIQVKLSRLLQSQTFQRNGETALRPFPGKIVASSSQNLEIEAQQNRFRADLLRQLRADVITIPSLKARLENAPDDLRPLVASVATRLMGAEQASRLTDQVLAAIRKGTDASYGWPGDIKELEQCVYRVMVHNAYQPLTDPEPSVATPMQCDPTFATADEVLIRYCTILYAKTGSYEEAARIANLDRRTLKAKIDENLLRELKTVI